MPTAAESWRADQGKMCRMVFRAADCLLDYAELKGGEGTDSRFFAPFFTNDYATKFTSCRKAIFQLFEAGKTTHDVARFINDTFEFFEWSDQIVSEHGLEFRTKTKGLRLCEACFNQVRFWHVIKLTRDLTHYDHSLHSRVAEILGPSDDSIVVGQSILHKSTRNTYREHVVPLSYLLQTCFEQMHRGASDQDLVGLLQAHVKIILIDKATERARVDALNKDTMPAGWTIGDNIYQRLVNADVAYELF